MNPILRQMLQGLLSDAAVQKRRVRMREDYLRRNGIRGPLGANDRPSPAWIFWQRSKANHRAITEQIRALIQAAK